MSLPNKPIPGSPAEWLMRARADLALARAPLPPGAVYEDLCFHAQQAAEKAIKALYRRRVAEDRPDCYWLYVVTNCDTAPTLLPPIKDPARLPWSEVVNVQHYALSVQNLRAGQP